MKLLSTQLKEDLARTENKWVKADAAVHQSRLVLEAAIAKFANGEEADASILVEAAKVILDHYAGDE